LQILSKDSVTVAVDAVVYYRISNATIAISNVEDYGRSTRLLAATTLRNVLGTKNLSEILSERESISHVMQSSLDEATDPWGVKVERVEMYANHKISQYFKLIYRLKVEVRGVADVPRLV
jgi:mechanosensory protein 2